MEMYGIVLRLIVRIIGGTCDYGLYADGYGYGYGSGSVPEN